MKNKKNKKGNLSLSWADILDYSLKEVAFHKDIVSWIEASFNSFSTFFGGGFNMQEDSLDCFIGKLYDNISEVFSDFKEARTANEEVYKLFWDNSLFKDMRTDLDMAIVNLEAEYERQGFIRGFKKALEIKAVMEIIKGGLL